MSATISVMFPLLYMTPPVVPTSTPMLAAESRTLPTRNIPIDDRVSLRLVGIDTERRLREALALAFRVCLELTAFGNLRRDPPGGSWQLGFCKLQAATTYGGLSGLSVGDAVRRGELVVDFARMAAFHALVLWTLRLTHRCDGRPVYGRRKAHQGARPLATRTPGSRAGDHAPLQRHDACPHPSVNRDRLPRAGARAAAAASAAQAQRRAGRTARAK